MADILIISPSKSAVATGELLSGSIQWELSKRPDKFILELELYTEGRGNQDKNVCSSQIILPEMGAFAESGTQSFSLEIPYDCPPSYSGALISVLYRLKLRADIAWKIDPKESETIVISPTLKAFKPPSKGH